MNKLSQINLFEGDGYRGYGPLGLEGQASSASYTTFPNFISTAIGILTVVAIIWFVFVLFTGALSMISAGSDKGAMEGARKKIASGLIGLIIVISGLFIISFVSTIFGVDFLDIPMMLNAITQGQQ